ncbi:MAG: hypothetical protein AABY22_25975 [Nanoarchaeota archaeon]
MELLIKRDSNTLEKTEGKADVDESLPDYLKVPRVVPQNQVESLSPRSNDDDLLIADVKDAEEAISHIRRAPK